MASSTNKRILSEITKLQALANNNDNKFVLEQTPADDPSSNTIIGKIYPKSNIYNQAAYRISLKLVPEYPFKAPEIRFVTPIYHPNVNEKGEVCVDLIHANEAWKPTTPLSDIVIAIINLIDNPNVDHSLIAEIGQEYASNRSAFDRKALESVKKHGLPRQ